MQIGRKNKTLPLLAGDMTSHMDNPMKWKPLKHIRAGYKINIQKSIVFHS